MNNYEVIIGQTKTGSLELMAIEYEWRGKVFLPTQRAEKLLIRYHSWKNLSEAFRYNLDLQKTLGDIFGLAL